MNGLARNGRLTELEFERWKNLNIYLDNAYTAPQVYQEYPDLPLTSWFIAEGAHEIMSHNQFYLNVLNKYMVPWRRIESTNPGKILYRDDVQVVVAPYTFSDDWENIWK